MAINLNYSLLSNRIWLTRPDLVITIGWDVKYMFRAVCGLKYVPNFFYLILNLYDCVLSAYLGGNVTCLRIILLMCLLV
jgi:hypothetical protein